MYCICKVCGRVTLYVVFGGGGGGGGKEPLQSVAGELKGLKGAEDVNQLKVQPIYYSLNETNTKNNVLFQSEFPVSSCKL